jgi:MFS family permease
MLEYTLFQNLSGLARYVMAATLARMATGGSTVAVILLARNYGAEGSMAGTLVACLTAPHILGPMFGRWLDKAQEPRYIIAAAAFLYPISFQLAMLAFEQNLWLTIAPLLVCGACGSLLMGGLSTQLASLVETDLSSQRRAQSWDTITYGIGLTMGPLAIAILTSLYSLYLTVTLLMLLPTLASLIILSFPSIKHRHNEQGRVIPDVKQVIKTIYHSAPLRRTIGMTSGASFSIAALPILSVYLSDIWQGNQESGAYLVTFYGIGCLCGALLLIAKPMKADAIVLLRNVGLILLFSLILVAMSRSLYSGLFTYWLCGVVNSIFFAVTLAARTEYAPKQGAAQIYLWVAAAKISAASLGAFVAGYLVDIAINVPLIVSSVVLASTIMLCFCPQKSLANNPSSD